MCGVVLPCVAVCCSVLQCVVVMYKMKNNEAHQQLQGALIKMGGHVVCCSVLQCVAVCCSLLQCLAMMCKMPSNKAHPQFHGTLV